MLEFFYNNSPNPAKVALFLEEAGLWYRVVPIDVCLGEQFTTQFQAINPNGKIPVIIDDGVCVFDSSAILLYLAEKTGRFLAGDTPRDRGELLSWLMFLATGLGPYCGQAIHFRHFAPAGVDYARDRYLFEARRHFGILNARLGNRQFIVGGTYTIADMAAWGWTRLLPFVLGDDAWSAFPSLRLWFDLISARPAAIRANELENKYSFKEDIDMDARSVLFKHDATQRK